MTISRLIAISQKELRANKHRGLRARRMKEKLLIENEALLHSALLISLIYTLGLSSDPCENRCSVASLESRKKEFQNTLHMGQEKLKKWPQSCLIFTLCAAVLAGNLYSLLVHCVVLRSQKCK